MLLRCVVRCPLLEFDVFLLSSWGLCIWERKITEVKGHFITILSGVHTISSVQFSRSVMSDSVTPWTTAHQAPCSSPTPGVYPNMATESVMPSNYLILCCRLLLPLSIFPSIRVFSNESALHIRWPKYCSFSFNISPSNEHPGLISFRMEWLDLLAVQGTLKTLPTLGILYFKQKRGKKK